MTRRNFSGTIEKRMNLVVVFFLAIFLALIGRLFDLQIINYKTYSDAAAKEHQFTQEELSARGTIYISDKNGNLIPLAIDEPKDDIIASPKDIKDPKEAAKIIAGILNLDESKIEAKLSKSNDVYEIIAKGVSQTDSENIHKAVPNGIYIQSTMIRNYPQGNLLSSVLGFVSPSDSGGEKGQAGLERMYNQDLSGQSGFLEGSKDASGFLVALAKRIIKPPKNGDNLTLTVDYNIQKEVENVLDEAVKKWRPKSAMAIVMNPSTGKIISLAVSPSFDPSQYYKVTDYSTFLNPAVQARYELGSVVKPITMAAGLQEGVVTPDTTYNDPGQIKIGGFVINNFDNKSHGTPTMTQVLQLSLNTGAVFVANRLGHTKQLEYLKKFGFDQKTGIDLYGEVAGDISNLINGRAIDYDTASFGQGISITPMELLTSIAAIANHGILMRPYIVQEKIDDSGNIQTINPKEIRQVISTTTAETLTQMMVSVIQNGFDKRAGVNGYFVAGKTGTAQITNSNGKGYSDKVIHSFVGFAPAFNPKFVIYLQLNEPIGNLFSANTLPPYFHEIAQYILNYYEIPPSLGIDSTTFFNNHR